MSWPDRFGFPAFNSVDWEMRERERNGGTETEQVRCEERKTQQMEKETEKGKQGKEHRMQ